MWHKKVNMFIIKSGLNMLPGGKKAYLIDCMAACG